MESLVFEHMPERGLGRTGKAKESLHSSPEESGRSQDESQLDQEDTGDPRDFQRGEALRLCRNRHRFRR